MMGQKIAGGMKRQRLSPLLPVEQAVAMRHYQMIDRYIAQQALPLLSLTKWIKASNRLVEEQKAQRKARPKQPARPIVIRRRR